MSSICVVSKPINLGVLCFWFYWQCYPISRLLREQRNSKQPSLSSVNTSQCFLKLPTFLSLIHHPWNSCAWNLKTSPGVHKMAYCWIGNYAQLCVLSLWVVARFDTQSPAVYSHSIRLLQKAASALILPIKHISCKICSIFKSWTKSSRP